MSTKTKKTEESVSQNGYTSQNKAVNKIYSSENELFDFSKNTDDTAFMQVSNTPFHIAKAEGGYYLLLGKYRLNDKPYTDLEEAMADSSRMDWNRILTVFGVLLENFAAENNINN